MAQKKTTADKALRKAQENDMQDLLTKYNESKIGGTPDVAILEKLADIYSTNKAANTGATGTHHFTKAFLPEDKVKLKDAMDEYQTRTPTPTPTPAPTTPAPTPPTPTPPTPTPTPPIPTPPAPIPTPNFATTRAAAARVAARLAARVASDAEGIRVGRAMNAFSARSGAIPDIPDGYTQSPSDAEKNSSEYKDPTDAVLLVRPRFLAAGGGQVQETLRWQLHDLARAELFSFKSANDDGGENNSIFLHERLNDAIRYADSNLKPTNPPHGGNLPNVLGFASEILDDQNDDAGMQIAHSIKEQISEYAVAQSLKRKAYLPGSNLTNYDAWTGKTSRTYLVQGAPLPGGMTRDITLNGLPAGFGNKLGFKPYFDQWRKPLTPSIQERADQSSSLQLSRVKFGPVLWT